MVWKPTREECALIRAAAQREGGMKRIKLEVGCRYNLERDDREGGLNILLVTDHPDWDDTDLSALEPWREFRKGVPLTADGRAAVDFYIVGTTAYGNELLGNVVAYYADGCITRLEGYGRVKDWLPHLQHSRG